MKSLVSNPNWIKRYELLIVLACLLIGFGLRFYAFDQKSLWMDEIHTYNDSRDDLRGQMKWYKENPTFLHPPLFFILTHSFYPFPKPERDLRIVPLIFGTLSVPMFYLLSRLFSPAIAIPCTLSLTLMAYHISLSQDGRSYSLLMFLGMASLCFFMKHLITLKKGYLFLVALCFALLFHTSYSSVPFIAFSQILWFYKPNDEATSPRLSSFLILTGLTFLFCLPWITFLALHFKGQAMMDPMHTEDPGPLWSILYGVFHDWVPFAPLMIVSVILLLLFPVFAKSRRNALVLMAVFLLPIGSLYSFCKLLNVTHFITSRYFINFLPLFLISVYLSLYALGAKMGRIREWMRLELLFLILFIASNLVILPLYYRAEKQDLRGLVAYLRGHMRQGDNIFIGATGLFPGILHYFGAHPEGRHHTVPFWKGTDEKILLAKPFIYQNRKFTIFYAKSCCEQFVTDGRRLWIVVGGWPAKKIKEESPCVLKGYFDGRFLNFTRFPTDASMYLFLFDPSSPDEKGIDLPIE